MVQDVRPIFNPAYGVGLPRFELGQPAPEAGSLPG